MRTEDWQKAIWKAVPSANILFPRDGVPIVWSIIAETDIFVVVVSGVPDELVATYLANSHNLLLSKP